MFSFDKMTQAVAGSAVEDRRHAGGHQQATAPDYFTAMVSGQYPGRRIGYGLANMDSLYAGFVNPPGPFNWFHTVDPQLDALYQQYSDGGRAGGVALQQQINARLVDQAWDVPVVGAPLSYYTATGLTGLDATSANSGVPLLTDLRPAADAAIAEVDLDASTRPTPTGLVGAAAAGGLRGLLRLRRLPAR